MDKDLRGGRFRRVPNYLRFCELYRPGMKEEEEEEEEILGMVFSRVMASSRSERLEEDGDGL